MKELADLPLEKTQNPLANSQPQHQPRLELN